MYAALDRLLLPVDRVRAEVYRALAPWLAPWMIARERRVAAMGILVVLTAMVLSVGAPLWLLALGPVLLGVPHVLADLRYLWVQPGFHRQGRVWLLVGPGMAAGAVTGHVFWGLGAATLGLFALPGPRRRRALGLAVLLPATAVAVLWPRESDLAFAHLHNVVAVALWWWLWPRRGGHHRWVLGTYVTVSVLLLSGLFDPITARAFGAGPAHDFRYYAWVLAPGLSPPWAMRVLVLYAFGQSVHYAIWLRLVPEDARRRPSPRPFRHSLRALGSDLGWPVVAIATVAAVVVAGWALVDLTAARDGYLRFAVAHGYLELAAAALFFVRGRGATPGA